MQFLRENTIYESLPQNSQVVVIDKLFTCQDTFEVLLENNCEEVIIWNSEISDFDGIITCSDVVDIVLSFYRNIVQNQKNSESKCMVMYRQWVLCSYLLDVD